MKYIIDHDLHIHSRLSSCSGDDGNTPAAILDYGMKNKFRHICLTDHFWDDTVPGASTWYQKQNLEHISKSLPLPVADGIKFHFGAETDMDKNLVLGAGSKALERLDFIIVPVSHLHMSGFTLEKEQTSIKQRADLLIKRSIALLDMDLPFYKMGLAHFTCGLLARGAEGTRDQIIDAMPNKALSDIFEYAATRGIGIELNMPVADCKNESVLRIYRIAKRCGCKFYLGSDAHERCDYPDVMDRFNAIIDALELTEDDKFPFCR